jgi:hypothetical protein
MARASASKKGSTNCISCDVAHDAVAADAVAGLAGGELIAALGVEAPIGGELCSHAARKLQPGRLLDPSPRCPSLARR